VAAAQRVAEVVAAQQWTNGAAGPIDMMLLGKCDSLLLQVGPQFEHQVIIAQLPTGGTTQPRSAQVGANPMLHNERGFN